MRWRVAQASPFALLAGGLAMLLSLAFIMAAAYLAAETPDPAAPHPERPYRVFWLTLDSLRALLGVDDFPRQGDNAVHQVLATLASVVGSIFPALVIGIAVVRLFTIRVFVWRTHVNACLAAELDDELRFSAHDKRYAFLAVRWYKRLGNLSLVNLKAEAYLRVRTTSAHDGSTLYKYQLLKVLGLDGIEASACIWPETFYGMPFTLWIPLDASLVDDQIVEIQGRRLADSDDRHLVVRLTASIAIGPTPQVSEEHRYHLRTDVQTGRFVPVDPDVDKPVRSWPGWRQFDQKVTHHLFLYGLLSTPTELLQVLGGISDGTFKRARLVGWDLTWRVSADNTDPDRTETYLTPGATEIEPIQVLFPTIEQKPGAAVEGLVVQVSPEQLAGIDLLDPMYSRRRVNDEVVFLSGAADARRLGVVWIYVGKPRFVGGANTGTSRGTALISESYLADLRVALAGHDHLLAALDRTQPRTIPVQRLERRPREVDQ